MREKERWKEKGKVYEGNKYMKCKNFYKLFV